ncbi:MAG TPA: ADP-ribosylglycohydrolase family protein [Ignavibacteriaceae bacterium]
MLGAVFGDVAGSAYEFDNPKSKDYPLLRVHWNELKTSKPTDDTICTMAVLESLLSGKMDFEKSLRRWGLKNLDAGYGSMYLEWLNDENKGPYNSWGNGSVMRTSACALLAANDMEAMEWAEKQSIVTHNHPNAVHAAKAMVIAIRMAIKKESKRYIRHMMSSIFGYDLSKNLEDLKSETKGRFDVSAGGTVRLALTAVLEAENFEEAIRNCIDLGGDTDTTAAVGGPVAEFLYGIPPEFKDQFMPLVPEDMANLLDQEYKDPRALKTMYGTCDILIFEEPLFTSENRDLLTGNSRYLKTL